MTAMENISLLLDRFTQNEYYTYGNLKEIGQNNINSFTLENGTGQKYIPAGTYEIRQRKVLSGLTKIYRGKFDWFTWHLELVNVPNAKYVYIHIGNTEEDTDACILVANTCDLTPATKKGFIGESTANYKELYMKLTNHLVNGGKAYITIK